MNSMRFAASVPQPADTPHQDAGHSSGSANTRRAYASDWKHFSAWCRRRAKPVLPPDPAAIAEYVADCATGRGDPSGRSKAVSTLERRISSLAWNFAQRGLPLDRQDARIGEALARLRKQARADRPTSPAVLPADLRAMLETLDRGTLRGLRDRAMLLLGFAGALRRSELTGLDLGPDQSPDGVGWISQDDAGLRVTLRGKRGIRTIQIGRAASDATCPIHAVDTWLSLSRIARGPLFRRVTGQGRAVGPDRLNDREVARLVNRTARDAGIGEDFASRALRAGRLSRGKPASVWETSEAAPPSD